MYRALIVEDEPPILRKITSSLRAVSDAFDIEVAHDGQEAFEYLMNHPVVMMGEEPLKIGWLSLSQSAKGLSSSHMK